MATILIQSVDHKTSNYAGSGGHDNYVPINLGETLDFRNVEFLKRGAFPVGFDGKLIKATTAKPVAGFLDPQDWKKLMNMTDTERKLLKRMFLLWDNCGYL